MTYEEAIEHLLCECEGCVFEDVEEREMLCEKCKTDYFEYIVEWVLRCIYHDGFIETTRGDVVNRVIKHALEKSTPQKPHKATTRYDEFIRFECPVCGGFLIKNYPCKCGKMIDWSEEE